MSDVTFLRSKNGKKRVRVLDYVYYCVKTYRETSYWRCTHGNCKGAISMHNMELHKITNGHDHGPPQTKEISMEIKSFIRSLKQRAKKKPKVSASQIYQEEMEAAFKSFGNTSHLPGLREAKKVIFLARTEPKSLKVKCETVDASGNSSESLLLTSKSENSGDDSVIKTVVKTEKCLIPLIDLTSSNISLGNQQSESDGQKGMQIVPKTAEKDDSAMFADNVAYKLRKLDDYSRTLLKHQIDNLVFQAEMTKCEQIVQRPILQLNHLEIEGISTIKMSALPSSKPVESQNDAQDAQSKIVELPSLQSSHSGEPEPETSTLLE